MDLTKKVKTHLSTTGALLASITYNFQILEYIITEAKEDERNTIQSYPVLERIILGIWSLVVLDLNKLFSESRNDKFSIVRLINYLLTSHPSITWEHKIKHQDLESIKATIDKIQPTVKKIKNIRDTQVAHLDNVLIKEKLRLLDLSELITFCQETLNEISFHLENSTTIWDSPPSEMFFPVSNDLNNYHKIKHLFMRKKTSGERHINISELEPIFLNSPYKF